MLRVLRQQAGTVLRRTVPPGTAASLLWFSSAPAADKELATASKKDVQGVVAAHKIVVFSKTFCPYCTKVKRLFTDELRVPFTTYELDTMPNGADIQATLLDLTGQRSVPNVFVGGEHIGGCDDTFAALAAGTLQPKLKKALTVAS